MVFARIRAQVVFPTPRGPQKRNACARCLFLIAFFKVVVMEDCPTTVLKVAGRYLRADTTKFSIAIAKLTHKNAEAVNRFQMNVNLFQQNIFSMWKTFS